MRIVGATPRANKLRFYFRCRYCWRMSFCTSCPVVGRQNICPDVYRLDCSLHYASTRSRWHHGVRGIGRGACNGRTKDERILANRGNHFHGDSPLMSRLADAGSGLMWSATKSSCAVSQETPPIYINRCLDIWALQVNRIVPASYNSRMNRSDLVDKHARHFKQLTLADTRAATDTIIGALTSALATGGRVEIRGFGSFKVNRRPARIGRNPKTGEEVQVPAKSVPHFKAGKELQERVDQSGR